MTRLIWVLLLPLLLGGTGPAAPPEQPADAPDPRPAETERQREYGSLLFGIYCVNCHGESGRGDGPTAEVLTVKPTDLTRIRQRNAGRFPHEAIHRVIDGRDTAPGHGRGRMPIWGLGFQQLDSEMDQEAEVRTRILALIEYLESIQAPSGE